MGHIWRLSGLLPCFKELDSGHSFSVCLIFTRSRGSVRCAYKCCDGASGLSRDTGGYSYPCFNGAIGHARQPDLLMPGVRNEGESSGGPSKKRLHLIVEASHVPSQGLACLCGFKTRRRRISCPCCQQAYHQSCLGLRKVGTLIGCCIWAFISQTKVDLEKVGAYMW